MGGCCGSCWIAGVSGPAHFVLLPSRASEELAVLLRSLICEGFDTVRDRGAYTAPSNGRSLKPPSCLWLPNEPGGRGSTPASECRPRAQVTSRSPIRCLPVRPVSAKVVPGGAGRSFSRERQESSGPVACQCVG